MNVTYMKPLASTNVSRIFDKKMCTIFEAPAGSSTLQKMLELIIRKT
jgi:hypothetical protein